MGIAPPEVAARRNVVRQVTATRVPWVVLGVYLLGALWVTARLWIHLRTATTANDPYGSDADLFAWDMRYSATSIAHGHLPALVTTALNAPRGINLMWNTSLLLPAVLLTPVTLLAGPLVSLTVLLTLGYFGSAAAMLWVLRRNGAGPAAAALGGAVYGFSPALINSGISHDNIQFAVLPPLIIDAVLRAVTGKGRPVHNGAWLGILVSAQLFIEEEVLTDAVIACVVVIAVLTASRRQLVRTKLRGAALGLASAIGTALVLSGYALWTQFFGHLTEHGSPFVNSQFTNSLGSFVLPSSSATEPWEDLAYLGVPLLVLLAWTIIKYWHDLRVRAAGVTFLVLSVLSLGGNEPWLPFHWLQGLPLLVELLPGRLSLVATGFAAVVMALWFQLARFEHASWPAAGKLATAAVAVLPLVPLPLAAVTVAPVPAGWNATFDALGRTADSRVLVVPAPYSHNADAMLWQADTGLPYSLVAGWFIGPTPSGQAATEYWGPPATHYAALCLDALWQGQASNSNCGTVRKALAYWQPEAVVAVTSPDSSLARYLDKLLGSPTSRHGEVLAWSRR